MKLRDGMILRKTLLMVSSVFCIVVGLLHHCWPAALLLLSCLCLDVHWGPPPVSRRCGNHLQQRVFAQELLYLRLSQPSCSCWILSVLRIQVLWYHQSVSKTDLWACERHYWIPLRMLFWYSPCNIFTDFISHFFRCWLSTENNFIWSFIGPACLIILVCI